MRSSSNDFLRRALPAVALCGLLLVGQAGPATAGQSHGRAHRTVTTAGGETFHLELLATPVQLPPDGGTVSIAGTGYNTGQGIFLAFCAIPDTVRIGVPSTYRTLPTPCLGGRDAKDGSARRITNTGTGTTGITTPYLPGGGFRTTLNLRPALPDGRYCGADVQCAIVTRSDFTATDDRSYDQYIPVGFYR